jgi:hypothetical protein
MAIPACQIIARQADLRPSGGDDIMATMPSVRDRCMVAGGTIGHLRRVGLAVCLLSTIVLLSGCVTLPDPESSQEFSAELVGAVSGGHVVGQSFVARRPRLDGIELWLRVPAGTPSANLLVELLPDPAAREALVTSQVTVAGTTPLRPLRVSFAPQAARPEQPYYFRLSVSGGAIDVLGRNEDAYPRGQAYVNGAPVDADVAFRLLYDYDAPAMLSDLADLLPRAWLALPLVVLLFVPGWLVLDLLGLRAGFDGGEQAALAAGLSLSLVPLLLLWTTVAGLRWNGPTILAAGGLLVSLSAWRLLRRRGPRHETEPKTPDAHSSAWTWALAGVFVVSLLVRLAMVRDLAAPAWVDSVHHALISQLIVDRGALPASYAPFLDLETASYHPGLHSVVAAFHWLSGLDVAGALLLLGQVLNALTVLGAYLLAMDLTRSRVVGLVAALVAGLLSPMPAYYASWGRYTQLAGLVVLPAALVLARRALGGHGSSSGTGTTDRRPWAWLLAAVLALAGLLLVHYRVAAFYGCYLLAWLVGQRYGRATRWRHVAKDGLRLGTTVAGALLLTLPWIVPTMTTLWLPSLRASRGAEPAAFQDFSWQYLTGGLGAYVLILAVLGLGWALMRRQRMALTLGIWVPLLFALAGLGVWGLPGGGLVNFVSVEISLFLPLAVLDGYVVGELARAWRTALAPRWHGIYRGSAIALFAGLTLLGAGTILPILNPDTVLFRQADEPAMGWIRENTPQEAVFLVNPMPWSAYMYAGADGAYWTSAMAGRRTYPPPVLYGLGSAREIEAVNELEAAVLRAGNDPDLLLPLLHERGITHVYLGARGGVLSAGALSNSPFFREVYAQNRVWVFEVLEE